MDWSSFAHIFHGTSFSFMSRAHSFIHTLMLCSITARSTELSWMMRREECWWCTFAFRYLLRVPHRSAQIQDLLHFQNSWVLVHREYFIKACRLVIFESVGWSSATASKSWLLSSSSWFWFHWCLAHPLHHTHLLPSTQLSDESKQCFTAGYLSDTLIFTATPQTHQEVSPKTLKAPIPKKVFPHLTLQKFLLPAYLR